MNASAQILVKTFIVQEPLRLAEAVCYYYIRRKATVCHRDVYWLVSFGLLQEFVT
jgi:hypothetical protein